MYSTGYPTLFSTLLYLPFPQTVLRIRICMDSHNFGKLDPYTNQIEKAGSGSASKSKQLKKIRIRILFKGNKGSGSAWQSKIWQLYKTKMEQCGAWDAHNGGVEAQNGAVEESIPDPHHSERRYPNPRRSDADPRHCRQISLCRGKLRLNPGLLNCLHLQGFNHFAVCITFTFKFNLPPTLFPRINIFSFRLFN